jgi:transglutaminase-like putative cysteine protease
LGTIEGDYWTSVTITVSVANSSILQLDTGAQAYATLDAGPISNSTPAATLQMGSINDHSGGIAVLSSTPDTDATNLSDTPGQQIADPFIQQEAAILDYDPQNIFNFLESDITYNSYVGSLRGARGTLWSAAGNALDVASLGVALMRASGIPAQYVSGTLSASQADALILSMFPASYQTVGYIPAGTPVATASSIEQTVESDGLTLEQETESHYWFEFNTGSGWVNADPLMAAVTPGGHVGQAFTASTGTFTDVPQALRATTEVSLTAEIYSQAAAAFGLNSLTETVVLDHTFDDVNLVGRPLTVGNFVNTNSTASPVFGLVTNTYTPYIVMGDDALPDSQLPDAITGQQYQENLTNFPLGSQILTGLFLNVTLSGPGTTSQTFSQTLVDLIGYAVRQGLVRSQSVPVNVSGPPTISPYDLTTLNILPGLQSSAAAQLEQERADQEIAIVSSEADSTTVDQTDAFIALARAELAKLACASDEETANLERGFSVVAYSYVPRIITFSSQVVTASYQSTISYSVNLLNDVLRALASPGQNALAALAFASARGLVDSFLEAQAVPASPGSTNLSAAIIVQQSIQQGIPLAVINARNVALLQTLQLPADAIARITANVGNGLTVIVPTRALNVNNSQITAWFSYNPTNGEVVAESQTGEYQALVEYGLILGLGSLVVYKYFHPGPFVGPNISINPLVAKTIATGVLGALSSLVGGVAGNAIYAYLTTAGATVTGLLLGSVGLFIVLAAAGIVAAVLLAKNDPPLPFGTADEDLPFPTQAADIASAVTSQASSRTAGQIADTVQATSVAASGNISASWSSTANSNFLALSLQAANATIENAQGIIIGSGSVAFASSNSVPVGITGADSFSVNGSGSLSFYGPANSSLGVSGDWDSYSATVNGTVSITLNTDGLTLNGQTLPAGTYTVTTTAATLSGSGFTASPNFCGSVSINATDSTINLGPGTGNFTIGGSQSDSSNGVTLVGYTGSITVASGGGNNLDEVTLDGSTANVLSLSATPAMLATNQDTPITFQANVNSSFSDTYTLTAQAPLGWTVTIGSAGQVTATPAPGLQGGTYPIQIVAQSSTDPNLVAQTTVIVSITPTQPGITFVVQPDPIFTVPYNGAELPTAFQAVIHNDGSASDTYDLNITNVPSGFTVVSSALSVTAPAGQTAIVGIYLIPITGAVLPLPGTRLSFNVTATSTSNPAITKSASETFAMPTIYAVTIASNPVQVSASPGSPATATVTLENVGNVAASAALNFTTDTGLTLTGLSATPITLAIGQTSNETVDITPAATVPLNTTLQATVNVGPAVTQNEVSVLSVTPSVANPTAGQTVDVSADIFAGVLDPRQADVSYTVENAQGTIVFTSTPVAISLSALATTTTLDLGTFTAGWQANIRSTLSLTR